jgi:hypothetical protein
MGQLLLRSTKSEEHPTRIDVLFQDVRSMSIPTTMDALHVTKLDDRTFRLSGTDWNGAVDAGFMVVAEDDGGYADPSSLFVGGVGN